MAIVTLITIILSMTLMAQLCWAQAPRYADRDVTASGYPAFRVFTDRDGLPQNTVRSIALDKKGYLWVGTQDGAAYYNGRKWAVVNMPNRNISNWVTALLAASDGSIFFGTNGGGLCRLKDGDWTVMSRENSGLPNDFVNSLAETEAEGGAACLWIGTENGLARFENGQWTVFNNTNSGLPNNIVLCLTKSDANGSKDSLWIGTDNGLAHWQRGEWQSYDTKNSGLPSNAINCVLESSADNGERALWAGTDKGLARLLSGQWNIYDTHSGLPGDKIYTLLESSAKNGAQKLWVGTQNGLARMENGRWLSYNTANSGLPDNSIIGLFGTGGEAGGSTIWIGTLAGGLVRCNDGLWLSFNTGSGLPDNHIYSFLETRASDGGSIYWFGTQGGLARLEKGQWTIYNTSSGLPDNRVRCLLETISEDGAHTLWVGTLGGLARLEKGRWTVFNIDSGLPNNLVKALLETVSVNGKRRLWVGTNQGLACLEEGRWSVYNAGSGLPDDQVQALLATVSSDGKETLWVGTFGGLACYQDERFTVIDRRSGLPNNLVRGLRETISADGKRILWVCTGGGGVAWLDLDDKQARWNALSQSSSPALPNNVIYDIRQDAKRNIYLSSNKGVICLMPGANDSSGYSIYNFTTEDGLPSNECNGGAAMIDIKGRIWVGTVAGAAMLDPSQEIEDSSPKPLYIEQLLINGKERPPSQNASLVYNENNLSFEYALLSLFRESDTRYRTQLVGFEERPSEWTAQYKREFTNLSEGDYIFKAWGKDYTGSFSDPIEIKFKIRPAPWRTWWAYFLYFVALTSIGYGSYRYRLQVLKERNQELEAKVRERTEQLAGKNEELGEALEQIKSSQKETERKNQELIESHKRADRIFSALAETLPGMVLDGKYRLDEKIGAGGFGAVYRATHLVMKCPIAVKIFRPAQGNDSAESLERFQQEAVSACRVNHPNAVVVLDSGVSSEGIAYLVMELLNGHSLTSELYNNRALSVKRCEKILMPICSVLERAHAAGIVHRDIKPDNIFLHQSPEGEIVKVVDFGIAKLMGASSDLEIKDLTATGRIIGTPNYMSPERFQGNPYDGRSDVYSLGVMVYQMLCGKLPFSAEEGGYAAVMMQHLTQTPPPLREINPNIPEEIEDVVMGALEKDPINRPTAKELAQEFATVSGIDWSIFFPVSFEPVTYDQAGADAETVIVDQKSQPTSYVQVKATDQAPTKTNETEKP